MKIIYFLFPTLLFLTSCSLIGRGDTNLPPIPPPTPPVSTELAVELPAITQISWGTSARLKDESLTLTETGAMRMKSGSGADYPFSKEAWDTLIKEVKLDAFLKLDEKVGCPGCADGEVEWIEITYGTGSKKVTFEVKDTILVLTTIRTDLRRIDTGLAASNPIADNTGSLFETGGNTDAITQIFWGVYPWFGASGINNCARELRMSTGEVAYTLQCYGPKGSSWQILTGSLDEEDWQKINSAFSLSDFSWLTTALPPPDSSSETLEITHNGSKERYIIVNHRVFQEGKLSEFFDSLKKREESLQNTKTLTTQSGSTPWDKVTKIEWWTSFWMCAGYCFNSFTFSSEKIIETKTSYDETNNPTIINKYSIKKLSWDDLVSTVDLEKFNALPDRIGCPDCADGWAEWIKITTEKEPKQVTFEYGKSVPAIDDLKKMIRKISQELPMQDGFSTTGSGHGR